MLFSILAIVIAIVLIIIFFCRSKDKSTFEPECEKITFRHAHDTLKTGDIVYMHNYVTWVPVDWFFGDFFTHIGIIIREGDVVKIVHMWSWGDPDTNDRYENEFNEFVGEFPDQDLYVRRLNIPLDPAEEQHFKDTVYDTEQCRYRGIHNREVVLGFLNSFWRIPHFNKRDGYPLYSCSEFVLEVLRKFGAISYPRWCYPLMRPEYMANDAIITYTSKYKYEPLIRILPKE